MSEQPTVGEQLATINVKLDLLITQRDDHEARLRVLETNTEHPADRTKRDDRLSALERFQWKAVGASGLLSGGLAAAVVRLFH